MKAIKRKMKFLATKLSALQSELSVSREIFQAASRDVEEMFQDIITNGTDVEEAAQKAEDELNTIFSTLN